MSVLSSKEKRIERIILRDGISYEKAAMRVSAQNDDSFYKDNSHFVLTNDGDTESFESEIGILFENVLKG